MAQPVRINAASRTAVLIAVVLLALGVLAFERWQQWHAILDALAAAGCVLFASKAGLWPRSRSLLIDSASVWLSAGSARQECARAAVKRCVVQWTFGTPAQGTRRTRFDRWAVLLVGTDERELLRIDGAQDFGAREIRRMAGILGVGLDSPPDWGAAQDRWSWHRLPAG